ncbi:RluA family pseudouridine synthase [Cytobacillus dafuensis]|uniref:Pseudouridine synthase n=1 Tax=Cytobacillus dafuensis TaxID=1742359 RepID=A0A5B8Z2H5_CYTDA|nr:RluA family pseudouridine synthase [Cytobacillus dafuensis]QED47250.1 RluA family pseudouridine synthase [Cytobacillus dafuensis]
MSRFQLKWKITSNDENKLIKDFLKEKEISKTALTDIKFKGGSISVNDKEETVRYTLKRGDVLVIKFPEEMPSEGVKGEKIPLDILYEDDYVIVVNKQAGMSTIPSREHPTGSLANALIGYYEQIGLKATTHIVTRLDRDTSGIVLVAKHRHVHHLLSEQQRHGTINREYEALAEGIIVADQGVIEQPIARKSDSIIEREVSLTGQYACTRFKVIRRLALFTHLRLKLETGRTHQIRVHLSHLGYPLIGDNLYGGNADLITRQALHCCMLSFYHPFLEKNLFFKQELPIDMMQLL